MEQKGNNPHPPTRNLSGFSSGSFPLSATLFLFLFSVRVSCLHPSFPSEPFSVSPSFSLPPTLLYYHTNI